MFPFPSTDPLAWVGRPPEEVGLDAALATAGAVAGWSEGVGVGAVRCCTTDADAFGVLGPFGDERGLMDALTWVGVWTETLRGSDPDVPGVAMARGVDVARGVDTPELDRCCCNRSLSSFSAFRRSF